MEVSQIAPGLWRWTAPHPDWTPEQGGPDGWERDVASYYYEAAGDILLIDPIVPVAGSDRDRFWEALDRDAARIGAPHVVLTCAWHARSAHDVLGRYPGARLWAPSEAAAELPDGLVASDSFRPDTSLPGGAAAIPAVLTGDAEVLLWLPSQAALVTGDVLLGGGPSGVRVCPDAWLDGADPAALRAALRVRLQGLPVERVLVTHGAPLLTGAREALERALE